MTGDENDPLAHVRPGDPDPEPDVDGDCTAQHPDEGWLCTRDEGHPGQHIACGADVIATWQGVAS